MKYIKDLRDGDKINGVYLCKDKRSAQTRNGKAYDNLILQDKTGRVDAKIWDPGSPAIYEFDAKDFIDIRAEVTTYNGNLQVNVRSARKAEVGDYDPADFMPTTEKSVGDMMNQLLSYINAVQNKYLSGLLKMIFVEDQLFTRNFTAHSAAKSVHHSFAGGLLEHTLGVVRLCGYLADNYPVLNRDLLYTAALCHDIGKTRELSDFPENDYTDEGQLLGHIVIGCEMLTDYIRRIEGFPVDLANQLKHCILAHHGSYEYGSPKLPASAEALAVNLADNCDAKLQIMTEFLAEQSGKSGSGPWVGFNKLFDSYIRRTEV